MKKITLVLLILTATTSFAQQLYIEGGKTMSSFDYKNSQGNSLENLSSTTNSYMAAGYRSHLLTKNLNIAMGINYSGYGAIASDDTIGNFMEWEVNYAGLNLDLDFNLFNIKKASVYIKGGMSLAFFVQGTQILNNTVIDLKGSEDFDNVLIGMRAGAGFSHPITNNLSFYVQYLCGKSMDIAKGGETLKIKSSNVSFGLLIDIYKSEITEKVNN